MSNKLTKEDYQTIVYDWNQTDKDYPKDKTVYKLFEEQVEANPNNVALVFEQEELTYRQLNEQSNQLARYIRKQYKEITNQELQADTLIPLCLERSLDMIIGILAVMKSGGAYVPMDPEYPEERFKHILKDTDAKLIITQSHLIYKLKKVTDINLIEIDEQDNQTVYDQEDKLNLSPQSQSTDLAYVIYTSGTTGLPKGVMVEYYSIAQVLFDKHFNNNTQKSVLWTSYVFDVSIYEMFSSLCFNKQLYIIDNNTKLNPLPYFEYLEFNKIEFAYIPPFYIKELSYYLKDTSISKLSVILTGVDKIYSIDTTNILNKGIKIINGYGPSETTTCSTKFFIDSLCSEREVVPIGMPLDNEKVYILDNKLQPVPVGVIGELYIGKISMNKLHKRRFIKNCYSK